MSRMHSIELDFEEEKIAQLLTRDAWSYFSSPTELHDRTPVRAIPSMPRSGRFEVPQEPQLIWYYLTFAESYFEEVKYFGWTGRRYSDVCGRFVAKIEHATGYRKRPAEPESRATAM